MRHYLGSVTQMQPEARFKKRVDAAFDSLWKGEGKRTAIEKGRGQISGLPDRLYMLPFGHIFLESKVGKNKPSGLQKEVAKTMAMAGLRVAFATLYPDTEVVALQKVDPATGEIAHPFFTSMKAFRSSHVWEVLAKGNHI